MNQDSLQQQIDERCPCFAKPLSECDCQFNDNEEEERIPFAQREAEIRLIDKLLSYKNQDISHEDTTRNDASGN